MPKIDSEYIADAIQEKGLTQQEFSKNAGVSQSSISVALKNGECSDATVKAIERALEVSKTQFLIQAESEAIVLNTMDLEWLLGEWSGQSTLILSRVNWVDPKSGKQFDEDECHDVACRFWLDGRNVCASAEFDSMRRGERVVIPSLQVSVIGGNRAVLHYVRESKKTAQRIATGIIEVDTEGDNLSGFLTTIDPVLNGALIPIRLELTRNK